jgi:hypothetical protein
MNKEKTLKNIEDLYFEAQDLHEQSMYETSMIGIRLIEQEARKILLEDDGLYDFIMAMGTCFFTSKKGSRYDMDAYDDDGWDEWCESDDYVGALRGIIDDDAEFTLDFMEMVNELNFKFNIKGHPMRFTATSNVVNDWGADPVVYTERTAKYLVEADHCILKRIDKRFYKEENALKLIKELCVLNYENIKLNGKEMAHDIYEAI